VIFSIGRYIEGWKILLSWLGESYPRWSDMFLDMKRVGTSCGSEVIEAFVIRRGGFEG
jgi:hypothetical protein